MPHLCPAQGVDQNRKASSVVHHEGHHVRQELQGCPNLKTPNRVRSDWFDVEVRYFGIVQARENLAVDSVTDHSHVPCHHLQDDLVSEGEGLCLLLLVMLGPVGMEVKLLDDLVAWLDVSTVIHCFSQFYTAGDDEENESR